MIIRSCWIEYKGRRILLRDYSNLAGNEGVKAINENMARFFPEGEKDLLVLVNITNSAINKESLFAMKKAARKIRPLVKKTAIVGTEAIHKFFINIITSASGLSVKTFNTAEEAKDWLVEDS